ncbi:MAG: hypothetical protein BWY47_00974 [Bacteroidetes bacterium ADurb.Bin302]|nr:MAG: hypothetical protein BWY47_00974 [Bacteroidetes bacterium ADurb.Bin302]
MNNLFLNLLIKQRLRSILKKQWLLLLAFPCLVILFSLKMPASFGRTIVYMGLMLLFSLSCFIEKGFEAESTYFDGLISWHSNSLKHIFICNNLFYLLFSSLYLGAFFLVTQSVLLPCAIFFYFNAFVWSSTLINFLFPSTRWDIMQIPQPINHKKLTSVVSIIVAISSGLAILIAYIIYNNYNEYITTVYMLISGLIGTLASFCLFPFFIKKIKDRKYRIMNVYRN